MTKRIDKTMSQIYETALQKRREDGENITHHEAMLLIKRADQINHARSFFSASQKCRGNKYLAQLMNENQSQFTLESKRLIFSYMHNGQIPSATPDHHNPVSEEDRDVRKQVCFPDRPHGAYSSHAAGTTPSSDNHH